MQEIELSINGKKLHVAEGTSVAAAILISGEVSRHSVHGEARTPFCGMGVCMECRATVDGKAQQRTCQMNCQPGMEVTAE